MGKQFGSEKKKAKHRIEIETKRYHSERKIIRKKKEKKIIKIDDSPIKNLILKLDDGEEVVNSEESWKIKFGEKMNVRNFYDNFRKGINYAKSNFSKTILVILKKILLIILGNSKGNIGDEFELKSCVNEVYKAYKIDFILSLIKKEKKIKELGEDKKKFDSNFRNFRDYVLLQQTEHFENPILYNANYEGKFSYQNFEQLLYSSAVLNAYERVLYELYGIKVTSTRIKNELKKFIFTHNIYFIRLPDEYYGLTLYDGTILLNKRYIEFNLSVNVFIIYFTLMHELMHVLSRILRGDDNFLLDTGDFVKKMKIDESGDYFDKLILLDCLKDGKLTIFEADYLLEYKNYNFASVDGFKEAFNNFRKKNAKIINNATKYRISKQNKEESILFIRNHCYCAGSRILDE